MKKILKKSIIILTLLLFWQASYYIFQVANPLLPAPLDIFTSLVELLATKEFYFDIFASLGRVLVGFFLAASLGVPLGLWLGDKKEIGEYFLPLIEILRPIPPIAWIPVAILLFGLGNSAAYFVIFLGAFFPIFSNAYLGARSLPQIYKNVAATFEFSYWLYWREYVVKYALPFIFTGLKIGLGMAWICVIAAEMMGSQSGLGYFVQINRLYLKTERMFSGIITIGLIGYLLSACLDAITRKIIKVKN